MSAACIESGARNICSREHPIQSMLDRVCNFSGDSLSGCNAEEQIPCNESISTAPDGRKQLQGHTCRHAIIRAAFYAHLNLLDNSQLALQLCGIFSSGAWSLGKRAICSMLRFFNHCPFSMGVWSGSGCLLPSENTCCRFDKHTRITSVILAIARAQHRHAYLKIFHSLILLNGSMIRQHLGALLAGPL